MKTVRIQDIEHYLLKKKRIRPEYLFSKQTPESVRKGILDDTMCHFTGFKLTRWGLALKQNPKYRYAGYKNYEHIKGVEGIVWDINHTNKLKRSYSHQLKRKVFALKEKKRQEREQKARAKKIINKHKEKWRIDHTRQERLGQLRNTKSKDERER